MTSDSPDSCEDSDAACERFFHQIHASGFNLRAQLADARIGIHFAARPRVGIGIAVVLQLVLGVGEFFPVRLDLAVDELVSVATFTLLGGQALADEQLPELPGDFVRTLRIGIEIADRYEVVVRGLHGGSRFDTFNQSILLDR